MFLSRSNNINNILSSYRKDEKNKTFLFILLLAILFLLVLTALMTGKYYLSPEKILSVILSGDNEIAGVIVWNIRLPRIIASVVTGWALALSGSIIQTTLKNPLSSPFTLGISHGAAFGAACVIIIFGFTTFSPVNSNDFMSTTINIINGGLLVVPFCAFTGAIATTAIIIILSMTKKMAPNTIVLAGVAISSLFASGTVLIQYFANELELSSIIFWTFGDVSRSTWSELLLLTVTVLASTVYFILNQWNYNILLCGDDTVKNLGVSVLRVRINSLVLASLIAALAVAFHGIIAFIGLLAPHMAKMLIGENHKFQLIYSSLIGGIILLAADTAGRMIMDTGTLPVGIITSFMGAPMFLYLLVRKGK